MKFLEFAIVENIKELRDLPLSELKTVLQISNFLQKIIDFVLGRIDESREKNFDSVLLNLQSDFLTKSRGTRLSPFTFVLEVFSAADFERVFAILKCHGKSVIGTE